MRLFARRIRTTLLLGHGLRPSDETPVAEGVVIETLNPADVDLLPEVNPGIELALEKSKLACGRTCYVARLDGRLAHYSWVQSSGVHSIDGTGRTRPVLPGELWIHACYTAAWARGKRVYPMTLSRILADYKARGFHRAWIYVVESNAASLKGVMRAGFQIFSRLRSLSIRNVTIPLP
jgi:hypothetical protein